MAISGESKAHVDQRDFLKTAAAATVLNSLNHNSARAADSGVPCRSLGRSGEKVSIVGIGGYHLGRPSEQEGFAPQNSRYHYKMLETGFAHNFTFDAVQMPLNAMDTHFDSFETKVLPVLI